MVGFAHRVRENRHLAVVLSAFCGGSTVGNDAIGGSEEHLASLPLDGDMIDAVGEHRGVFGVEMQQLFVAVG